MEKNNGRILSTTKNLNRSITSDIQAINKISIVPQILDVVCRTTKMGFAAIARVTENQWITCTTKDDIAFGLKPGDELKLETTLCSEVRNNNEAVFIEHVEEDPEYFCHPTPKMYGFKSYISVPIYRKDGRFFGTLCAIDPNPAKVKNPEVMGMFRLFSDLISFHLNAIEEMEVTAASLAEERQTAELRDQFIAILGHDLRNPIATTRMSAEILLQISQDDAVKRQAKIIKNTSFRMESLIGNILDFARGRLGEGIILEKTSDSPALEKILRQIISEVRTLSAERDLVIHMDLEEEVICDGNRMGQLFSNLLENANSHGALDHPITVEAVSKAGKFKLSVSNGGEKISDSAMQHLFRPFYREAIKPGKQGLGLGLFIAAEIAKAHGGNLEVTSTDMVTKFTFTMPLA